MLLAFTIQLEKIKDPQENLAMMDLVEGICKYPPPPQKKKMETNTYK